MTTYIFKIPSWNKNMRFLTLKTTDQEKAIKTIAKRCGVNTDQVLLIGDTLRGGRR